jgi:GT2 family glycosyltransferase
MSLEGEVTTLVDEASVAVIVASAGRPMLLGELINRLSHQTYLPNEVVLSVPSQASLPTLPEDPPFRIVTVLGVRGSAAQRNAGIDGIVEMPTFVVFFDDDAVPRNDYLENCLNTFSANPAVLGLSGRVLLDGAALGSEVSVREADHILASSTPQTSQYKDVALIGTSRLYGCNFAVRYECLQTVRFDERLPLYSWLEDLDFSKRLSRLGPLVKSADCVIVHLGAMSGGRTQHYRFGYSQVTNPAHLWRQGSISALEATSLALKPALANVAGSVLGADRSWRLQRLKGNIRSVKDLVRGRITPDAISHFGNSS